MIRDREVFWANSIDFDGRQCKTLIHWNGLTERLGLSLIDLPVHQTCEIRKNGVRLV